MLGFGLQHLVTGRFVTRIVPEAPPWLPVPTTLAYLLGVVLIAASIPLLFNKRWSRHIALALGALLVLCFVLIHVPRLLTQPINGRFWTHGLKCLSLAGGAFAVAAVIRGPTNTARIHEAALNAALLWMARASLGVFMMFCCFLHFIYAQAVAPLVPAWIPGAVAWTYITAVALFAGGLGLILPKTRQLAATASGLMLFSWVMVLHVPRVWAFPNHGEIAGVFEALAFSGLALVIAVCQSPIESSQSP
jgi:uncharacterized membrane protein